MTAGQDGTPENDDPFGYLYRAEDGGEQPAAPRASYNQVQRVGERRPQQQGGGYGYPPQQQTQQQGGYGYPQQTQQTQQQSYGYDQGQQPQGGQRQYAPPQQQPGEGGGRRGAGPGHGGGDAPNRKGLLIAAVAVVVAVAIGIGIAMSQGDGKPDKAADNKPTTPAVTNSAPTTEPTPSASPSQFASDKVDASTFALAGPAAKSTQWPGANAAGGTYVDGMGQPGASATWTVTVPEDGDYTFFISYGNAGPDATLSLSVDGKMRTSPVKLKNYGSYTDWSKAWDNTTYAYVNLTKGDNTLQLSFQPGDTGGVNLDQVWLKQGQVKK
ncbi:carbohydrate-binding protein [Actinacidiphila paucisporea]|uniref:Carbohydrate binding module (Family 6) n=1 Tax=Actinacidiphila paucisporea TaxID=310782 RepID=A0A1M7HSH5_9ACTN|nr:carbohydrate-binding protein [Actinacidiphila paucisporea]SHM31400.1 Carbohydrate binding module (family 6) [Actinacidiphila paucisporea]